MAGVVDDTATIVMAAYNVRDRRIMVPLREETQTVLSSGRNA